MQLPIALQRRISDQGTEFIQEIFSNPDADANDMTPDEEVIGNTKDRIWAINAPYSFTLWALCRDRPNFFSQPSNEYRY